MRKAVAAGGDDAGRAERQPDGPGGGAAAGSRPYGHALPVDRPLSRQSPGLYRRSHGAVCPAGSGTPGRRRRTAGADPGPVEDLGSSSGSHAGGPVRRTGAAAGVAGGGDRKGGRPSDTGGGSRRGGGPGGPRR